ncbi:MAG: uncharacterized protein A8A55_0404 [Amphiamblys sp. WSBS2006]|nr:MAG: uncharacterized protein A8A55_0404 [Amphiamblys sp. WSBS2006]
MEPEHETPFHESAEEIEKTLQEEIRKSYERVRDMDDILGKIPQCDDPVCEEQENETHGDPINIKEERPLNNWSLKIRTELEQEEKEAIDTATRGWFAVSGMDYNTGSLISTNPVCRVVDSFQIHTCNGNVYRLLGSIDRKTCLENGIEEELVDRFVYGFPANWKELLTKHAEDRNEEEETSFQKNRTRKTRTPSSPRRSPRVKIPPVRWWLNENPDDKMKELGACPENNDKTQE